MKILCLSLLVVAFASVHDSMAMAENRQCRQFFAAGSVAGWLPLETNLSVQRILQNISPSDSKPGAIVAADSRQNPPYYFHWVRDAGLTIEALIGSYERSQNPQERAVLRQRIQDYARFSEVIQNAPSQAGLGEPKFNIDGTPYTLAWGRPQNDGPAIRASSLINWYRVLDREGKLTPAERSRLYSSEMPARSVIKKDLEYVANHWHEPCFDLWEEVKGDHFYTRMVQRRALIDGARLADDVGDGGAAQWYRAQAAAIETDLMSFWDSGKGYFVATKNRVDGADYKISGLDISVILGLLHGSMGDGFLPFDDARVVATMAKLERTFAALYPINQRPEIPGIAIGRYPEDRYSGSGFGGGNPWPLATLAMAEAYYRMAEAKAARGEAALANMLFAKGDQFVARVDYHANADGSLYEQMDRNSGFMTSAKDLTWNYAAVLTTTAARDHSLMTLR